METGNTVLLYTDGVTDMENPGGEKFESARLYKTFEENTHRRPRGLRRRFDAVEDFRKGTGEG